MSDLDVLFDAVSCIENRLDKLESSMKDMKRAIHSLDAECFHQKESIRVLDNCLYQWEYDVRELSHQSKQMMNEINKRRHGTILITGGKDESNIS